MFFGLLSSSLLLFPTTSFIETTGVACSDSVSHNRVQVLSIPVLLKKKNLNISTGKKSYIIIVILAKVRTFMWHIYMIWFYGISNIESYLMPNPLFIYIYIYIYSHPQTDCFVLSELFSVARHVGCSKSRCPSG